MTDLIASPDKYFYTTDRKTLTNMVQLSDYLKFCDAKDYAVHVDPQRNDFANWIEGVFGLKELAEKLRNASGAKEASDVIIDFLQRDAETMQEDATPKEIPGHDAPEHAVLGQEMKDAQKQETQSDQQPASQPDQQPAPQPTAPADGRFREYTDEELDKFTSFVKREREQPADDNIESLKAELAELRNMIKDLRRAGKDAYIADLILRVVDSKLAFYGQTKNPDDKAKITDIMNDAKKEIEYCQGVQEETFADDLIKTLEIQRLAMRKDMAEKPSFAQKLFKLKQGA